MTEKLSTADAVRAAVIRRPSGAAATARAASTFQGEDAAPTTPPASAVVYEAMRTTLHLVPATRTALKRRALDLDTTMGDLFAPPSTRRCGTPRHWLRRRWSTAARAAVFAPRSTCHAACTGRSSGWRRMRTRAYKRWWWRPSCRPTLTWPNAFIERQLRIKMYAHMASQVDGYIYRGIDSAPRLIEQRPPKARGWEHPIHARGSAPARSMASHSRPGGQGRSSSATQSIAKYWRELGCAAKPASIGAAPPRPSRTANEA